MMLRQFFRAEMMNELRAGYNVEAVGRKLVQVALQNFDTRSIAKKLTCLLAASSVRSANVSFNSIPLALAQHRWSQFTLPDPAPISRMDKWTGLPASCHNCCIPSFTGPLPEISD